MAPLTIAVLGVTGAGKSTFIKSVSNDRSIVVGNNLSSCTSKAAAYTVVQNGTTFHLVDTPGFDDTTRSDKEILHEIASWLSSNLKGVALSGVIYLHRITDTRMQGTELRNLRTFQRILGGLGNVVFATTFWDKIDEAHGAKHEAELAELWREGGDAVGPIDMWRLDGKRPAGIALLEMIKSKQDRGQAETNLDVSTMVARMQEEQQREQRRLEEEERRHRAHVEEMERQARREMEARRQQVMRQREAQRAAERRRQQQLEAQMAAMRASKYDSDSDSDDGCILM